MIKPQQSQTDKIKKIWGDKGSCYFDDILNVVRCNYEDNFYDFYNDKQLIYHSCGSTGMEVISKIQKTLEVLKWL